MTDDDLLTGRLTTMLAERAEDVVPRPGTGATLGRDVVRRGHAVRRRRRVTAGSVLAVAAVALGTVVLVRPNLSLGTSDPAASTTTSDASRPAPGPLRFEPRATRTNGTVQFDAGLVLDPDWPVAQVISARRVSNGWVTHVALRDGRGAVAEVRTDGSIGLVTFPKDTFRGMAVSPDGNRYVTADRSAAATGLRLSITSVTSNAVQERTLGNVDGDPIGGLEGWTSKGILLMTEPADGSGSNQWLLWDPATGTTTTLPRYTTVFATRDDPDRLVIESDGCWRTLALDQADLTAGPNAGAPDRASLGPLVQCAGADSGSGAISVSPAGTYLLRGGLVSALDGSGSVTLRVPGPLGVLGWEDEHTVVVFTMTVSESTSADGRPTTSYTAASGTTPQRCDVRSGACIAVDTRGNTGWLP